MDPATAGAKPGGAGVAESTRVPFWAVQTEEAKRVVAQYSLASIFNVIR